MDRLCALDECETGWPGPSTNQASPTCQPKPALLATPPPLFVRPCLSGRTPLSSPVSGAIDIVSGQEASRAHGFSLADASCLCGLAKGTRGSRLWSGGPAAAPWDEWDARVSPM